MINKNIICSSSTVLPSTTQTTTNQQKQSQISSGFGSNVGGSMLVAQICGKNVVINSVCLVYIFCFVFSFSIILYLLWKEFSSKNVIIKLKKCFERKMRKKSILKFHR